MTERKVPIRCIVRGVVPLWPSYCYKHFSTLQSSAMLQRR